MSLNNKRGTIHVDVPLSNLSIAYPQGNLIADIVSPRVSVKKESDKYYIFGRTERDTTTDVKADKAVSNRVDTYETSTGNYSCEEHALYDLISDRERQNADRAIQPDMAVTNGLTRKLLLNREVRVATEFTTDGTWNTTTTLSGTSQFNNAAYDSDSKTGSIEARIDTAKEAIRAEIGIEPNVIIMPEAVAKVIKKDPEIRKLRYYTESGLVKDGDLSDNIFNLRILRPGGIYNTAAKGQTQSMADVWGKHLWIGYINPVTMGLYTMTAAMTMMSNARKVNKWREESEGRKCDAVEAAETIAEKIISTYCGFLYLDVIA